jgi:methylated-DNA-protein-cysteine methyltransferase-like protein
VTSAAYRRVYAVVRRIPRGRVATYGQVAALAGLRGHARQVGYALHALGVTTVPWHRVINSRGEVSPRSAPGWDEIQRELLEDEGVYFDARGRVDLASKVWRPRNAPSFRDHRGSIDAASAASTARSAY